MSQHQKPSPFFPSDWFQRRARRMGSFFWDDDFDDMCYTQHYNGRPLSVALTEPFDPFEPQSGSFFDDIPHVESDFASLRHQHHQHQHHHHHHHHHQQQQQQQQHFHQQQRQQRSRSSGRRYKRECYSVHYPNAHSNLYCFSPPPPPPPPAPRRLMNRAASREVLIEKIETVTIAEPPRRQAYNVSFVRAPSPPVRQLKIRPRPSSCFDLRKETTDLHQQQRENRWSKHVDEHHEEHFEYQYEFHKIPDRIVPIEREPPPTPPKIRLHDATTSTEDLVIPRPPTPKPIRPETREAATTTAGLPRRPLCVTETQVIERFEKTEKVRRDSTSSTEGADDCVIGKQSAYNHHHHSSPQSQSQSQQPHRSSRKASRKDFLQRMRARNGTTLKPCNTMNLYSADERRREKARVIVRPTAKPREILVDTSGIFGFPGEFSEPSTPLTIENGSTNHSRSPFCPPDLR